MPCKIYRLDFQEKNFNLDPDLNHGSPDHLPGALNHRAVQVPTSNAYVLKVLAFGVYRFKRNI